MNGGAEQRADGMGATAGRDRVSFREYRVIGAFALRYWVARCRLSVSSTHRQSKATSVHSSSSLFLDLLAVLLSTHTAKPTRFHSFPTWHR